MDPSAIILFIFNAALTLISKGDELWAAAKQSRALTPEGEAQLLAKRNEIQSRWAAKEAALKAPPGQ